MHREDDSNYLLYIEPPALEKLEEPVEDELVDIMEKALSEAKEGTSDGYDDLDEKEGDFRIGDGWRGVHSTPCRTASSTNKDYLLLNGMITNSLAPFYLRWYRDSIPASEMKKLEALKVFYGKSTLERLMFNAEPVDPEDIAKRMEEKRDAALEDKKRYEIEIEEEKKRIDDMACPCCKSADKERFIHSKSNHVIGPGYYSRTILDYYICQGCGVHYTDMNKKEIQPPMDPHLFL